MFVRGKVLCSMDAVWRLLGYNTYPRTIPGIRTIKIKTEEEVDLLLRDSKICDILVYFNRLPLFGNLTYVQFFSMYRHAFTKPQRFQRLLDNNEAFSISIDRISRTIYVFKRDAIESCITRMELTSFYDGEKWYLRLILKSTLCNSFRDMKTWNNNTYNTYQESAIARGLVADQHECFQVFDEKTKLLGA